MVVDQTRFSESGKVLPFERREGLGSIPDYWMPRWLVAPKSSAVLAHASLSPHESPNNHAGQQFWPNLFLGAAKSMDVKASSRNAYVRNAKLPAPRCFVIGRPSPIARRNRLKSTSCCQSGGVR